MLSVDEHARLLGKFEIDRLFKLIAIEAKKEHDGHYTVFSFSTGYVVAFGIPDLDTGYGRQQVKSLALKPTLKEALIAALSAKEAFAIPLDEPAYPCGPVLECPACAGPWLHHGWVEVFERPREDAEDGLHVSVRGMQAKISTDIRDNPSSRRDGLLVSFSCEWCCAQLVLHLVQHKGQTLLIWEDRHNDTACGPDCDRYPALAP